MAKIGLFNMSLGFFVIFLASLTGVFNAIDLNKIYLAQGLPQELLAWQIKLLHTAHGHFNLFGMIHILFGLTIPYSQIPKRFVKLQTAGISLGTFAMGPLMALRALAGPESSYSFLGISIGVSLVLALAAILVHSGSMLARVLARD